MYYFLSVFTTHYVVFPNRFVKVINRLSACCGCGSKKLFALGQFLHSHYCYTIIYSLNKLTFFCLIVRR